MLIVPSNVAGASTSARAAFVQDGSSGADDVIPLQLLYSPNSLVQRLVAMFLGETEAPRESGKGRLASDARLELVVAADVARVRFWKAHEHEVTRACAPALIDKQEVFAYLLADVLGRPLLPPDETRGVGRRGDNAGREGQEPAEGQGEERGGRSVLACAFLKAQSPSIAATVRSEAAKCHCGR